MPRRKNAKIGHFDTIPANQLYSRTSSEHQAQAAIVRFCQDLGIRIFAIPNGAELKNGGRSWRKLEAEGAAKGVPDLFVPYARKGYHGLFIELKVGDNQPSEDQVDWLDWLARQNYLAVACWGSQDAIVNITEYMR